MPVDSQTAKLLCRETAKGMGTAKVRCHIITGKETMKKGGTLILFTQAFYSLKHLIHSSILFNQARAVSLKGL
jgi:hypothetical protein